MHVAMQWHNKYVPGINWRSQLVFETEELVEWRSSWSSRQPEIETAVPGGGVGGGREAEPTPRP